MVQQYDLQTTALEWRAAALSPLSWLRSEHRSGTLPIEMSDGESGGFIVRAEGLPLRGYLKPSHAHKGDFARAAREKIASDLAHELRLPVPPAVLAHRHDAPADCETAVVVSLVMHPRNWPWCRIMEAVPLEPAPSNIVVSVFAEGSGMWPFDTWLDQAEHGDHPFNILWSYSPANKAQLVFLDYAFSMGHQGRWDGGGWAIAHAVPFPNLIMRHLDRDLITQTIEAILALPEATIHDIVFRLPETHLPAAEKSLIFEGLIGRRGLLREIFDR